MGDLQPWTPVDGKTYPVLKEIGFEATPTSARPPAPDAPDYMVYGGGEVAVDIESIKVNVEAVLAAVSKPVVVKSTPRSTPSVLGQMWDSQGTMATRELHLFSLDGDPPLRAPLKYPYRYDPDSGWDDDPLEMDDG